MKVGHASRQIQLHQLGCPLMTPNDCPFVTTSRLTNRIEASGRTLRAFIQPRSQRCTTRLLKRRAIHAGLIMTPGLIGKPRKSPPVGKPRVPSQGSVVAVSPPCSSRTPSRICDSPAIRRGSHATDHVRWAVHHQYDPDQSYRRKFVLRPSKPVLARPGTSQRQYPLLQESSIA